MSPDFTPLLMTAFGDLFLRDHSDRIHFLDLMSGEFKQVADSQEDFERLCEDRERRRSWFLGLLLTGVRTLRGELAADECYSCKIPLSFGGQLEPDNFERSDLLVHYSILDSFTFRCGTCLPARASTASSLRQQGLSLGCRSLWANKTMHTDSATKLIFHIVDHWRGAGDSERSAEACCVQSHFNPEGWQRVAGGRSGAETPGRAVGRISAS